MSSNVIRDGQWRDGYVAARERLHDEIRFRYRPMLAEDVELTEVESSKGDDPRKGVRLIAAQVSQRVGAWSEVDEKGETVPITVETVRRLRYPVLLAIYKIVAGLRASDPDPNNKTEDAEGDLAGDIIRQAEGKAPGQEQLLEQEGN